MAKQQLNSATKLETYDVTQDRIKVLGKTRSSEVQNAMKQLLQRLNDFNTKNKIQCMYRVAVPEDKAKYVDGGLEVGKLAMPTTLLNFLLGKYVASNKVNDKSTKPSALHLYAMLLKHQKYNVKFSGTRLLVCFDTGTIKTA